MPPVGDDNFLSELAQATGAVEIAVEVTIPLTVSAIALHKDIEGFISDENREDIAAIAAILGAKGQLDPATGRARYRLRVGSD